MYVYFTVFFSFQFTFSLYYIYQSDVSKTIRLYYSREIKYNCLQILFTFIKFQPLKLPIHFIFANVI